MKFLSPIFLLLIWLSINSNTLAQETSEISMSHSYWNGTTFQQNGKSYKYREVTALMKSDPQAYDLIKSAKSSYDFTNVLGFAGGFMIGWPLGTAIGGGDPNWTLAAIGAGLVVIAIPISNGAKHKAEAALKEYNSSLKTISQNIYKPKLEFASMATGLGLRLTF